MYSNLEVMDLCEVFKKSFVSEMIEVSVSNSDLDIGLFYLLLFFKILFIVYF